MLLILSDGVILILAADSDMMMSVGIQIEGCGTRESFHVTAEWSEAGWEDVEDVLKIMDGKCTIRCRTTANTSTWCTVLQLNLPRKKSRF